MPKRPKRKTVIKKLDDLARDILKEVYPNYCVTCGKPMEWFNPTAGRDGLQVSHYIGRDIKQLRWDFRNIHPMCGGCNIEHNKNPIPYTRYLLDIYGATITDELQEIRRESKANVKPIGIPQLLEIYEQMKIERFEYKQNG